MWGRATRDYKSIKSRDQNRPASTTWRYRSVRMQMVNYFNNVKGLFLLTGTFSYSFEKFKIIQKIIQMWICGRAV